MQHNLSVNLGNLILSLSDAMDLATPSLIQHQQRTAFVAWKMAKAAQLDHKRVETIFIAALIHDIGAFSLEEKISLRNFEVDNLELHCIRGELLLRDIPWLKDSGKIIRFHHKAWQLWAEPISNELVFDSQILFLADYLERHIKRSQYILHQHEDIIAQIKSLSGNTMHPWVVDLFLTISESEEFWLDMMSPRLFSLLFNDGPVRKIEIELANISDIAGLFRNIIDFRSRFTSTHSSGVAASAAMLARIFGFTESEVGLMEVAGNLHDIGKLAIPNSILDKPGKLTREEMAIMKQHTYHTYALINTIGGLKQIAQWAAYHHEKLDGSGYPFHCTASDLSTGSRILAVADIFTALTEDRPYRSGMPREGVVKIIRQLSDDSLLDRRIANLLFENYDEIRGHVAEQQAVARDFYEKQFAFSG